MLTVHFKEETDAAFWPQEADWRLVLVFDSLCHYLRGYGVGSVVITSFMRPNDPGSVHAFGRGLDIRTHDFSQGLLEGLVLALNQRFIYDVNRTYLVALYEPNAPRGAHLHLQVPHENAPLILVGGKGAFGPDEPLV